MKKKFLTWLSHTLRRGSSRLEEWSMAVYPHGPQEPRSAAEEAMLRAILSSFAKNPYHVLEGKAFGPA